MLITVVETPEFIASAKAAGMTESEVSVAIDIISKNPTGGVSLGGGIYKVRVPRSGGGKSGGYRVVSLYVADDIPAYLLSVINKTVSDNFSMVEVRNMKQEAKSIKRKK